MWRDAPSWRRWRETLTCRELQLTHHQHEPSSFPKFFNEDSSWKHFHPEERQFDSTLCLSINKLAILSYSANERFNYSQKAMHNSFSGVFKQPMNNLAILLLANWSYKSNCQSWQTCGAILRQRKQCVSASCVAEANQRRCVNIHATLFFFL